MGLEMLSIVLGIHTFADDIRGKKLVIHSDNRGSEVSSALHVACFHSSHLSVAQFAVRRGAAVAWAMLKLSTEVRKICLLSAFMFISHEWRLR